MKALINIIIAAAFLGIAWKGCALIKREIDHSESQSNVDKEARNAEREDQITDIAARSREHMAITEQMTSRMTSQEAKDQSWKEAWEYIDENQLKIDQLRKEMEQ